MPLGALPSLQSPDCQGYFYAKFGMFYAVWPDDDGIKTFVYRFLDENSECLSPPFTSVPLILPSFAPPAMLATAAVPSVYSGCGVWHCCGEGRRRSTPREHVSRCPASVTNATNP